MAVGRISGPLLAQNLFRDGIPLAFYNTSSSENAVLYLDVAGGRVGVRKNNPSYSLDVTGTLNADALRVVYTTSGTGIATIGRVTISSGTISTTLGPLTLRPSGLDNIILDSTVSATQIVTLLAGVESTTTNSGSLIVAGGVGISNNLNVGGDLNVAGLVHFTSSTQSTATGNGAVVIDGGLSVAKDIYLGGTLWGVINTATTAYVAYTADTVKIANTTSGIFYPMLSTSTGYSQVSRNTAFSFAAQNGLLTSPLLFVNSTTQSTSTISGAAVISGGLGVAKDFYLGGQLFVQSIVQSTSTNTGAVIVNGGVAVKGNLNVAGDIRAIGNITAEGNIQLGNSTGTDTLIVDAEIQSDLIPIADDTYSVGSSTATWAQGFFNELYTKVIASQTGPIIINPASNLLEVNAEIKVNGQRPIGTAPVTTNILYVTMDGDDTNDGRAADPSRACRTIGGAVKSPAYTPGTSIKVAPGHYFEDNPIILQPYTSIIGSDLRTTSIEPINKTQDLFHVQSGCYLAQMQFLNGRSGLLPGPYAPGYNRGAYAVAFPPQVNGSQIDVFHSPYVQNCTNQTGPWLYDGTLFVPNQTVQVPLAVGTGTWAASATSITVTLSTGTVTAGMSINPGQQNPGYFNARTLLLANKPFIQEQVVAYVNQTFPTFTYNRAKCFRDVGIIVENVSYDVTFGGNEKSVESGLSYYDGVTSVIAGQESQTIAAINYINTLSQLIIANTSATNLLASSSTYKQVINTVLTGGGIAASGITNNINIITSIINSGTSVAPTVYKSSGPDSSFLSAEVLMQANRRFMQKDTVSWIKNTYPTFVYNTATCFRDVGLIIDAVSQDIILGGNTKTIEAALSYWNGGYPQIVGQESTTTAALSFTRDLVLKVISNTPITPQVGNTSTQVINTYFSNGQVAAPAVSRNFAIINDVIVNGPEVAPPVFQGAGVFVPTGMSADDTHFAPKILTVTPVSGSSYTITIDTPTVSSATNAYLYFGNTAVFPALDADVPDQWAQRRVDQLGGMGGSLVDGGVVSKRSPIASFVYDAYTQVAQGGRGIHIINDGYAQLVSVFTIFCSTAVEVGSGGIASITNSNSNFGNLCLVAKGYGRRQFSGTIYNPPYPGFIDSGQYYPNGYFPQNGQVLIFVPDTANRPHIALVMEVEPPPSYSNDQALPGFLSGAVNLATLTTGTITISPIDTSGMVIGQTLYIRDQYGRFTDGSGNPYISTGTIITDVGYQSITLNKAVNQGGGDSANPNYFSVYACGNAYYSVLSSTLYSNPVPVGLTMIPGIQGSEAVALDFISTVTQKVISNLTATYYSTITQAVLPSVAGGSGASSFISNRIGIIKNIAVNGVGVAPTITTSGTLASGVGSAITLIKANTEYIAQETLGYLNSLNPAINYNRVKCKRDIGLIVDAIAQDLVFNGTSQTTFAGLQYWNQSGYTGIIGTEITTTTNAINYVSSLAQRIVRNITTGTRYQSAVSQVTNTSTATVVEAGIISADFAVITDILTNGPVGASDKIIPNSITASTVTNTVRAYNLLQANKTYIQAEAVAFVEATKTPGFVYDQAKCSRDVGYMVDSVSFDLLYGGNRQAIQSGVYYYSFNGGSSAIQNESTQTLSAYSFIKAIVPYVIKGINTGTYQTLAKQVTNISTATNSEATILQGKIDVITNIIQNGPSVAAPAVPIGLTASTATNVVNAAKALIANKEFIKNETVAYIDQIFNLGLDKDKCARDVRLILQQLIYDLETGGNYYSVYSGLSYWSRDGTYHLVQLGDNINNPSLMPDGCTVNFYQRSYMSASGYTFEYVGAGVNYGSLPQVGRADPIQSKEVVQIDNGKVFFTSTDQNGDFRIGPELVISQATGVLSGRTFTKSLFANLTPFMLAIGVG